MTAATGGGALDTPSRAARVLAAHARDERDRQTPPAPGVALTVFPDRVVLDEADAVRVIELHAAEQRRAVKHPERLVFVSGCGEAEAGRRTLHRFAATHATALRPSPRHSGEAASVAVESGLIDSGDIVLGLRPEAGALGALGALVLKTDVLEVSNLMLGRPLAVAVPPAARVRLSGRMPRWAGGFDLALELLVRVGGRDALLGRMVELSGPGLSWLSVPERLAFCATLAAHGLPSVVEPDATTATWLAARRATLDPAQAWERDQDSGTTADAADSTAADAEAPAGASEPAPDPDFELSGPRTLLRGLQGPLPGRTLPVDTSAATGPAAIHEVLLGGRIEDLRAATELLRERNVKPGLHLCVIPDSQRTLLRAVDEGLVADLLRAGASLWPPGSRPGPPLGGTVRVATQLGMAASLWASPALAAACAVHGRLMHPEVVMRMPRRGATMA